MKHFAYLNLFALSLFSLLLMSSCGGDKTNGEAMISPVEITFKALYDGQPLQMNEKYTYEGKDISFSNVRFYLSDIALTKGNLEVTIDEIEMINFSNNTDIITASEGIVVKGNGIPLDIYDGIKFGIGVPSDLNMQLPTDFSNSHPLSLNSEYWDNWDSYIFHKIEGRYDYDGDQMDLEEAFVYHVGIDQNFREKIFANLDVEVKEGETTEVEIKLDVKDILQEANGDPFDFPTIGSIHSSQGDGEYPGLIADNWVSAFSL